MYSQGPLTFNVDVDSNIDFFIAHLEINSDLALTASCFKYIGLF